MQNSFYRSPLLDATALKWGVYIHMLQTRLLKYAAWMCILTIAKALVCACWPLALFGIAFFKNAWRRLRVIDLLYAFLHLADDIVDDDAPVPPGWSSALAYIERLIHFVTIRDEPQDRLERGLGYVLDLAAGMGMSLTQGILDILNSMRFDATRRSGTELRIVSAAELWHHFHLLDIRGTITLWLIILRERTEVSDALALLGEAIRIYYNIRDLEEDMRARLCNIPREAFAEFGIPVPHNLSPEGVRMWCRLPQVQAWCAAEKRRGWMLFTMYRGQKSALGLHPFTRGVLTGLFEISATKLRVV